MLYYDNGCVYDTGDYTVQKVDKGIIRKALDLGVYIEGLNKDGTVYDWRRSYREKLKTLKGFELSIVDEALYIKGDVSNIDLWCLLPSKIDLDFSEATGVLRFTPFSKHLVPNRIILPTDKSAVRIDIREVPELEKLNWGDILFYLRVEGVCDFRIIDQVYYPIITVDGTNDVFIRNFIKEMCRLTISFDDFGEVLDKVWGTLKPYTDLAVDLHKSDIEAVLSNTGMLKPNHLGKDLVSSALKNKADMPFPYYTYYFGGVGTIPEELNRVLLLICYFTGENALLRKVSVHIESWVQNTIRS